MTGYLFEIVFIIVLIIFNALFSLSELAVVSSRKSKLKQMANEGNGRAKIALQLAESPEDFLSTIQVGITSIGIVAGVFGGATIAEGIAAQIENFQILAPYREPISLALVVIPITYFSLVMGELVPKQFALNSPEKIACLVAQPMIQLTKFSLPVVKVLSNSTKFVLKIVGFRDSEEPIITEEEIKVLISQGREQGTFHKFEEDMIRRVFRLSDRSVSVLMTPRKDVRWIDANAGEEEIKATILSNHFASFLLCEGEIDRIKGSVKMKDFVKILFGDNASDFKSQLNKILSKPLFLSESIPALRALEAFKKNKAHLAVVIDEFGTVQGILTLNDVLQSVFEELSDDPHTESNIIKRQDGSLLISGSMPLDEFFDEINMIIDTKYQFEGLNTVGGFVTQLFTAIPKEGDAVEWNGYKIEVIDMDGRRVDKILLFDKRG